MLHRQHSVIMEESIQTLEQTKLFDGIAKEDIQKLLKCTNARLIEYEKGEMVILEGSIVTDIGIILSGCGRSIKRDADGKTMIITLLDKGSLTGVLLAASKKRGSPVSVQAQNNLSTLFIPIENVICRCSKNCSAHNVFLHNYIDSLAEKALVLHDRNDCLIKPTVREKIRTYLIRISKEKESKTFTIPLDRNSMAEYLNIERSALSRELSKMKKDGLIDYYKNSFKLL